MSYEHYLETKDELIYKDDKVFILLGFGFDGDSSKRVNGNSTVIITDTFKTVKVIVQSREKGYLQELPLLSEKCFGRYTEESYKEACEYFKQTVSEYI
ncbi:hypothetical protein VP249E411_P0111 [Vibrio phage 249E41-1]|nr:hypothetical protein VP249E411_P0111 [Vibrio phage 249E41-1]